MRSHLNYFKLFFERDLEVLKQAGFLSILIPSSYQTDEGSYGLRKLSILENQLLELSAFENRGYEKNGDHIKLFPDVDSRMKFSFVYLQKTNPEADYDFNSRFYITNPEELYKSDFIHYNKEKVSKFSPLTFALMEFRDQRDYELCSKIKAGHPVFHDKGYLIRREFHVSDDRELFKNEGGASDLPAFEGKTIHRFDPKFGSVNKYIDEETGHELLLGKECSRIKKNLKIRKKAKAIQEEFIEKGF